MDNWIFSLPKIDLHCHLDGSIPPALLRRLAQKAGLALPRDAAELRGLLTAEGFGHGLAEYLEKFDLPLACLATREAFSDAARALVQEAADEQVRYLEVRFAPLLSAREGLSAREIVEGVLDGLRDGACETGTTAFAILCGMRHFPAQKNRDTVLLAREYLGAGVCAVDLAGDERADPLSGQTEMFRLAKALGVPFTIHAGECGSRMEVAEALGLGARRVGHGIAVHGDPGLLRFCAQEKICLELCPTSNLQTGAVKCWEDYPFQKFVGGGVPVSINTDNRTVSGTTLTRELTLLQTHCGATREQLRQVCRDAANAAFAPEAIRQSLLSEIDAYQ